MLLGCSLRSDRFFFFLSATEGSVVRRGECSFGKWHANPDAAHSPANFAAFGLFQESFGIVMQLSGCSN